MSPARRDPAPVPSRRATAFVRARMASPTIRWTAHRPAASSLRGVESSRAPRLGSSGLCLAAGLLLACGDAARPAPAGSASTAQSSSPTAAPSAAPSVAPSGSASPSASLSSAEADEACATYAKALCAKEAACRPVAFTIAHGDPATCEKHVAATCRADLAPDGAGATRETLDACAAARTGSCEALVGELPAPCRPPGPRALGKACGHSAECASGFCDREVGKPCGTCASLPTAHQPCQRGVLCDFGLGCGAGLCLPKVPEHEACTSTATCQAPLRCVKHECAAPGKAGDRCDVHDDGSPSCDEGAGLVCRSGRCAKAKLLEHGARCDKDGVCTAGEQCGRKGVCEPPAKAGDPCSPAGPFCAAPAVCAGGVCAAPSSDCR
jgi:hypothetical protein